MNKSGEHIGLDPFNTPSESIPPDVELPVFWIAPLEAGGRPLLSPPNQLHCVLTVQDCVMAEQRRLSLLFPDEIVYFLQRASGWREPPILYDFLVDSLQNEVRVAHHAVHPLMRFMERLVASGSRTAMEDILLSRACHALSTLAGQPAYFRLSEVLRALVMRTLQTRPTKATFSVFRDVRLEDVALGQAPETTPPGVTRFGRDKVCAVVHICGRPRWGPPRATLAKALEDRRVLFHALQIGVQAGHRDMQTLDCRFLAAMDSLQPEGRPPLPAKGAATAAINDSSQPVESTDVRQLLLDGLFD